MNNFSELTLQPSLHTNLSRNLFVQPTPVQAQSLPHALAGLDLVATAQTGTGKTLAFLLPIMQKLLASSPAATAGDGKRTSVRALVLSPTRELAIQIADTFHKLSPGTPLRAAVVVGGLGEQSQLNAIRRGAQIIIATPGRLEDFLNRRLVDLTQVQTLVLDEADRMLDMGFLPAIERILGALPKNRQSMFFSATMEKAVERLIAQHSKSPIRIAVGSVVTKLPEGIDLHLYEVENDLKFCLLRHMLEEADGSFLVFARTKHGTDRLAKKLSAAGLRAVAMHGDRTQNQRNQALAGFREGRYRVLVATDVAARGIHVDNVAHVVNFDLPQAPDDFVHRVGRTGRAGQSGAATTFSLRAERGEVRRIERECKVRLERREIAPQVFVLQDAEKSAPEQQIAPVSAPTPEKAPRHHAAPKAKRPFAPSARFGAKRSGKPFRSKSSR